MFPSNSSFTEKLVRAKQADIDREIYDINRSKLLDGLEPTIRTNVKTRMLVVVGALVALVWLFGLIH